MIRKDEDIFPLSALWHYAYCPRRFYFIFIQGEFEENFFVADGYWKHKNIHQADKIKLPLLRRIRQMKVESKLLGLFGVIDVVEVENGKIFPVEFKRGGRKPARRPYFSDCVLASAQGIALSETLNIEVKTAQIFYFSSRKRFTINISQWADRVSSLTEEMRRTAMRASPPPTTFSRKCIGCSLIDICLPWEKQKIKRRTLKWGQILVLKRKF